MFTLGEAAISWKSSKQTVNTRSTIEAEFVAVDTAAEEAEWLKSFIEGIPLWPILVSIVIVWPLSPERRIKSTMVSPDTYEGATTQ